MANGSTRTALSEMALKRQKAQEEQNTLLKLSKKGTKLPKISLKNPTKNNHSRP